MAQTPAKALWPLARSALIALLSGLCALSTGCVSYRTLTDSEASALAAEVAAQDAATTGGDVSVKDPLATGTGARSNGAAAAIDLSWRSSSAWPRRLPVYSGLSSWGRAQIAPDRPLQGMIIPAIGPLAPAGTARPAQAAVERELYTDVATLMKRRRGVSVYRNYTVVGEGPGSLLFTTSSDPFASDVWQGPAGKPVAYYKFLSARAAEAATGTGREVVFTSETAADAEPLTRPEDSRRLVLERTWFALYEPLPEAEQTGKPRSAKGLVVLLPGMFGTPQQTVQELVGHLRSRGFAVLRMLAHPSRFTEQVTFGIVSSEDLDAQAELVARTLGDRAAECAYAVQAAVIYAKDTRADLRALPVTLLGLSGGAMVLPTVAARQPNLYQQALLVAGGADFLRLSIESNYRQLIDAVHFVWFDGTSGPSKPPRGDGRVAPDAELMAASDHLPPQVSARFSSLYHKHAALDSRSTGSVLSQLRTRMILARNDRAVPIARGMELWQQAGRPPLTLASTGHELLFLTLPGQFDDISTWIAAGTLPPIAAVPARQPAAKEPALPPVATP